MKLVFSCAALTERVYLGYSRHPVFSNVGAFAILLPPAVATRDVLDAV